MKSINSLIKWILFVPVCVLSVAIALFNGLNPGSVADFFATNRNGVAEIIAFSVLGLFLVCFVISLFDRRTSPAHMLKKNYFCGIVAIGVALSMAANAAFDLTNIINNSDRMKFMTIITILLTAVAGISMLYLGLNHFNGKNSNKNIALLYLTLPLWCAAHLIDRFLNNTATPVAAAESMDLIMFVALAMFFVNVTMIHGVVTVKNSVKSAINYGLPAVVISFVYCINSLFDVINSDSFVPLDLVPSITYGMIALYAMGFVAELSFRFKTVDEQIIIEQSDDENNEIASEYYDDSDNIEEIAVEDEIYSEDIQAEDMEDATDNIVETDFDLADDEDDYLGEDNISFDAPDAGSAFGAADNLSLNDEPVSVYPAVRQAVDDDSEDVLTDEESFVSLDDAIDFSDDMQSSEDSDVADELYKAAQQQDSKTPVVDTSDITNPGSDKMILDGDKKKVERIGKPEKGNDKPKGPTTREAIMYEDDEFILADDTVDAVKAPTINSDDLSSFILDSEVHEDEITAHKSYEDRLDEIDRLIISIQGGDGPNKE